MDRTRLLIPMSPNLTSERVGKATDDVGSSSVVSAGSLGAVVIESDISR